MALTKVTKELIQGGLGIDWQATVKTGNFQAVASQGYFVNTTSNQVIVTMPPTASVGDIVSIVDYAGTAQTNNIKITAQSNINGSANDVKIDYQRGAVSIIYSGTIQGWVAEFAANDGTDALVNISFSFLANYLVVAGGGGGAGGTGSTGGGGGGAGGYRTNYNGTALTLSLATPYLVTIGSGGNGGPASSTLASNGNDSVFYNITSTKGGGGSAYSSGTAGSGGSGGGGSYYSSGSPVSDKGLGNTPSTTPSQGNNGGIGENSASNGGGGGGGASSVGAAASSGGGAGGTGTSNSITGSALLYAGGGGGAASAGGYVGGAGGSSIGGLGGNSDNTGTGGNGITSRGGGGGGAASGSIGGNGSSGIVTLRYPTASVSSFAVTGTLDTTANTAYPIANTAYYKLNSNANDATGIYNGAATASVSYPDGRFGKAASGFTTSQYVSIPTMGLFLAKNTSSVSMWIKISAATSPLDYIFADYAGSSYNHGISIYPDGSIRRQTRYSSSDSTELSSGPGFADNNWHHVVSIVNASSNTNKLYVDGILVDSGSVPALSWSSLGNVEKVLIGGLWGTDQSNNLPFGGSIDQVRIFNSEISAGNVTSLYNEGTVVESTDGTNSILQFIGGTGNITFS